MILRVNLKRLLQWVALILISFPEGIAIYMPANVTILMLGLGVVLLMMLTYRFFLQERKKLKSFHYLLILFSAIVVICTLINKGDILRAIKLVYSFLFGAVWTYGYMSDDYWETVHILATWGKFLLVVNLLLVFIFPQGVYVANNSNKDTYAFLGNINNMEVYWIPFGIFWISDMLHRKRKYVLGRVAALFVTILYPSYVYNCMTGLLIGLAMFIGVVWIISVKQKLFEKIPLWLIVVVLTVAVGSFITNGQSSSSFLNSHSTFLGRIGLWTNALNMIGEHPLVGYGVLDNDYVVYYNQWLNHSAHNQYLMLGIWGGLPLMICFVLLIIDGARHCSSHKDRHFALINLAIIGFMVYYIVEFTFNMSMFFILFSALILHPGENRKLDRRLL